MASIIDPESAKSLIQEYQQQNSAPGGAAIKTHEGHLLNGYFLDRESLESILSNPKVVGVSLHLAKHPASKAGSENYLTVIYGGSELNPATGSTPYLSTGDVYGPPPPCPPSCTR